MAPCLVPHGRDGALLTHMCVLCLQDVVSDIRGLVRENPNDKVAAEKLQGALRQLARKQVRS